MSDAALPPPSVTVRPPSESSTSSLSGPNGEKLVSLGLKWAPDCVWGKLVKNERVTRGDWWQDVREIEIEVDVDGQNVNGEESLYVDRPFSTLHRPFSPRFCAGSPLITYARQALTTTFLLTPGRSDCFSSSLDFRLV